MLPETLTVGSMMLLEEEVMATNVDYNKDSKASLPC
jgi:hypothetical protein